MTWLEPTTHRLVNLSLVREIRIVNEGGEWHLIASFGPGDNAILASYPTETHAQMAFRQIYTGLQGRLST